MTPKKVSDFRYDTGHAKIAWNAVGEPIAGPDVLELVKFLVPPSPDHAPAYQNQLANVARELKKLAQIGGSAGKLTLGNQVLALQEKCAKFLHVRHVAFLTNCTAGFEIAFKFAHLQPDDEVIAPAITFIATIAYPLSVGAKVVLADVDPRTLNMDPADVAEKITPKTKAIIPVHLGGYPADMQPLMKLAKRHHIMVLEDAAHAFGAQYHGKMIGSIGDFGAFSFHEVKNLTSLGEGGILCTNSKFGQQFPQARFLGVNPARQIPHWLYDVDPLTAMDGSPVMPGNHSPTEIQALILIKQMDRLPKIIAKRKKAAEFLNQRLAKVKGLILPLLDDPAKKITSSHHLYLLQIDPLIVGADIQALKTKLAARGVTQIPHFAPLYKFEVMKRFGYDPAALKASCPVAEQAFRHRFTHLPLYNFNRKQLDYLAQAVIDSVTELRQGR